jgi:hypothetical protein
LCGNNGYSNDFGRTSAARVLSGTSSDGLLERDVALGALAV